jgi:hypothetical protein
MFDNDTLLKIALVALIYYLLNRDTREHLTEGEDITISMQTDTSNDTSMQTDTSMYTDTNNDTNDDTSYDTSYDTNDDTSYDTSYDTNNDKNNDTSMYTGTNNDTSMYTETENDIVSGEQDNEPPMPYNPSGMSFNETESYSSSQSSPPRVPTYCDGYENGMMAFMEELKQNGWLSEENEPAARTIINEKINRCPSVGAQRNYD